MHHEQGILTLEWGETVKLNLRQCFHISYGTSFKVAQMMTLIHVSSLSKFDCLNERDWPTRLFILDHSRLNECIQNIVKTAGRYHVVSHGDTPFLQFFLWKRFGTVPKTHYNMMY